MEMAKNISTLPSTSTLSGNQISTQSFKTWNVLAHRMIYKGSIVLAVDLMEKSAQLSLNLAALERKMQSSVLRVNSDGSKNGRAW